MITTQRPPANIWDNSKITEFWKCPRSFYYKYVLGLIRLIQLVIAETFIPQVFPAIEFGSCCHKAWELIDKKEGDVDQIIADVVEVFRPFEPEPTISRAGNEIESLYTTNRLATVILEHLELYKDSKISTWNNQVELGLTEELAPGIYYAGLIDRVVETEGKLRALDYKTTKVLSSYIYNPHDQLTGYQWLLGKFVGKENVGGVIFDMVGLAKTKRTFVREPVTFTEHQIETWKRDATIKISTAMEFEKQNFWPKNTSKCNDYFKPCTYLPLCTAPTKAMEEQMIANYEVGFWTPFDFEGETDA